uniref:Glycosyltransferase 2-like domain-containing protein n=1 Tax=Dicentrarchus labrax TaxID=13489 RepID=A0A8P4GMN2_DICLA
MAVFQKPPLQLAAVVCVILVLTCYFIIFYNCPGELIKEEVPSTQELRLAPLTTPPSPGPCTCSPGSVLLKDCVPKDQYEELVKRRAKEFQQQKARSPSELSKLLFALPNSPLQYPTQGFTVRPLTPTLIPGLALHAGHRSSYKVSLHVSKGILTTEIPSEGVKIQASFQFDKHEAVFPITIKQPQVPVLYDMGTDISSQVTITTKTFLRYRQLKVLLNSIRSFYSNIEVIIADDSFEPEHITGEHIQQYIMPPAQGWFAGRNLAISQVTTKYFLWVDDDFVFTQDTKIEKLVEVMESVPELDVLGGKVDGNQFYFYLHYEEGEEMEGGCLDRKSKQKFHPLPGYPQCSLASGVVNFFLARTDAVQRVRFDPKLKRVAHSEFFMDGLGSLLVASCGHVSIGHQPHSAQNKDEARYVRFRHPQKSDEDFKLQLHFFKNHLKCVRYE